MRLPTSRILDLCIHDISSLKPKAACTWNPYAVDKVPSYKIPEAS